MHWRAAFLPEPVSDLWQNNAVFAYPIAFDLTPNAREQKLHKWRQREIQNRAQRLCRGLLSTGNQKRNHGLLGQK
jgi:hypothetical protein